MKRLAVVGHPVSHSRSPAMQRAALAELGLGGWTYEALDIEPGVFAERLRGLASEGFVGVNVTIPHKQAALRIATSASLAATEIGASNTLSFSDGAIHADNTDAAGLLAVVGGSLRQRRALVLGAGGAARAAVWALAGRGAQVEVWNRTPERAASLAAEFGVAAQPGGRPSLGAGPDLLVNTSAAGLDPGEDQLEALGLQPGDLRAPMTVIDLVYPARDHGGAGAAPETTALVRAARAAGATAVDGLEILVRQGAESLRIWTGLEPPLEAMREAARAA